MTPPKALTSPLLEGVEGLVHGFLTRRGGVSPPPFDDLNLSAATGDRSENVAANLEIVRRGLGFDRLAAVSQVHGADIISVDGRPSQPPLKPLPAADGLVTAHKSVGLLVKVADCLGVILCDPEAGVVGLVHAGWRGLRAGVLPAAVALMCSQHHCRPRRILAGISPSLGPCCAEFVDYRRQLPKSFWDYKDDRDRFDLWAIAHNQLTAAGLASDLIHTAGLCTRCRGDLFYSHRGQGPITGRCGVVVGWSSGFKSTKSH